MPGEPAPKSLGLTGPWQPKGGVVVPANAVWYVKPLGGAGFNSARSASAAVALGFSACRAGPAPSVSGPGRRSWRRRRPRWRRVWRWHWWWQLRGRQAAGVPKGGVVNFGGKLTGKELKVLVAEMKKQSVPGLAVENLELTDADLAELKAVTGLETLLLRGPTINITDDGLKHLKAFRSLRRSWAWKATSTPTRSWREAPVPASLTRLHWPARTSPTRA